MSFATLRRPFERLDQDNAPTYRRPSDIIAVGLSLALLIIASLVLLASRGTFDQVDNNIFRTINRLPSIFIQGIWFVMQAGSGWAIPVAAGAALLLRRVRLAGALALAGSLAWYLNKLLKLAIDRGRPFDILDDVVVRGVPATGLGFPSGHVTIITAMAMVSMPYLPRRWRYVPWLLVAAVSFARIYVGAHFPIDVIGGWALGALLGAVVNLVLGVPQSVVQPEQIRETFESYGIEVATVEPVDADARASVPYFVTDKEGKEYFAKLVGEEQRTADFLFKVWRTLLFKNIVNAPPFLTPMQQVEHEAYLSMLARQHRVNTPEVLFVTQMGDGLAMLAQERVSSAVTMDKVEDERLADSALLEALWTQVKRLHEAHIAHGDLRLANIVLTESGDPWLIDFGFAQGGASPQVLAQDSAQMLASLATHVGAKQAVTSALGVLGEEALAPVVPALQPMVLSSVTREELKEDPERLEEVEKAIREQVGVEIPEEESVFRIRLESLLWVFGLGVGVYFILPQLGELNEIMGRWRQINPLWLAAGLVTSALAYVASAYSLKGALLKGIGLWRSVLAHFAATFANRFGPRGLGGALILERFLEKSGLSRRQAISAITLKTAAGSVMHLLGMVATLLLLGEGLEAFTADIKAWQLWLVAAIVIGGLVFLAASPDRLKKLLVTIRRSYRDLRKTLSEPRRALMLFGGAAGTTLAYIATLAISMYAVGSDVSLITIAAVYLAGEVIGSASPTPGGLGVLEGAFVAGFATFGVSTGVAVAGVLLYRLLTFWLPILPGLAALRYLQGQDSV